MNKKLYPVCLSVIVLSAASTAFADTNWWYTSPTMTTVQGSSANYSRTTEQTYSGNPDSYLPSSYVTTTCKDGSCSTQSGAYDLFGANGGSLACSDAAASEGLSASDSWTCSENFAEYGYNCFLNPGSPNETCMRGGSGEVAGAGTPQAADYRRLLSVEVYKGNKTSQVAAPCKPAPSRWQSEVNTTGIPPGWLYTHTECTTSVHVGTAVPTAVLTANPSSVVAGSSSALTYSCSDNSTSAVIDNGVGTVSPAAAGTVPVTPGTSTTYRLTCTNANGTGTATATVTVTPPVNGVCGTSNGTTVATAPSTGLCSVGTASAVAGTGPWTWSCAGSGGGTTASCSANKTVVTQPDLTAFTPPDVSGTAGQPIALSVTVRNQGAASTGTSFPAIFIRNDVPVPGVNDTNTFLRVFKGATALGIPNGFPAGYSEPASASFTPPSAGTWYYRLCVDLDDNYTGYITESDEGNNCSGTGKITVAAVPSPVPTCSLSASPNTIPSTLTWSSTNATLCSGGGFSTGNATSGSVVVGTAGTYNLTCTGAGGTCNPIGSVTVGGGACTNPTGILSAAPTRVQMGQGSTLTYNASGITTSCVISGPNGYSRSLPAASCSVPTGTAPTGALTTQSTYILTCDGVERARTIVNVLPKFQNF
jgi:hypothetical protein